MQKKLIALALASAFAAPAFAATSNVDIFGQMNVSVDMLKGKNAAGTGNKSEMNVSSNASFIGFKGAEDLGGGLKAIWELKTYVSLGGTGTSDTGISTDSFVNGNAFAGLSSGMGTVVLGKMEGPMKLVGRKVDLFNNTLGDVRNFSLGFDTRPNNTIAYMSPDMAGFQATVAYVTNMDVNYGILGVNTSGATTNNSVNAWSGSATYTNGPLFVGLGYERHNLSRPDSMPATTEDEKDMRVAAGYTFSGFKLVGMYEKGKDLKGVNGSDRTVYGLGGAYNFGASTIKAQWYKAGKLNGATDTGANMWAVGYDYAMSKRTIGYVGYAKTNNDAQAAFSAFGGGHGDNPGTVKGLDPSGFTVGMIHNF
ncbi:MAG: porin [Thiobacillus sp.]